MRKYYRSLALIYLNRKLAIESGERQQLQTQEGLHSPSDESTQQGRGLAVACG